VISYQSSAKDNGKINGSNRHSALSIQSVG
jgi:hypothetical protein